MRAIDFCIVLLLLLSLVTMDFDSSGGSFQVAQGNPQETGELLPDPNLMTMPIIEIGDSSPEFSYQYQSETSNGNLNLIWTHMAGYQLDYENGFPNVKCKEFARSWHAFNWQYNQTPITLKIKATVEISCTGSFASQEYGKDMYSINFWIGKPELSDVYLLTSFDDLEIGRYYDLEFQMQRFQAEAIFSGSVMIDSGQGYLSDEYRLAVGIIPTLQFFYPLTSIAPWEEFQGTVTATITHISVTALLEARKITPSLKAPKYNSSDIWKETDRGLAIEPIDQNSLSYLIQSSSTNPASLKLGRMTSQHTPIMEEVQIPYSFAETQFQSFKAIDNRMYILGLDKRVYGISLIAIDSNGNEIWNSTYSLFDRDVPIVLDVSATGKIYIVSLSERYTPLPDSLAYDIVYSLLCIDQFGIALWNQTLDVMSLEEYAAMSYNWQIPRGLGCVDGDVYIGMVDSVMKYDSSGNHIWTTPFEHDALCIDPAGGFYTCSKELNDELRLTKWNSAGEVVWNRSLSLNYGLDWQDHPTISAMEVGPDGQLVAVLVYSHIHPVIMITRISRMGQIVSQDSISEETNDFPYFNPRFYFYPYTYAMNPYVCDMALTGDGLVHLAVRENYYGADIYSPFPAALATILFTYELSGPIAIAVSPEVLIITGVTTLIFMAIAWDYFIRGRTRPEEILPE